MVTRHWLRRTLSIAGTVLGIVLLVGALSGPAGAATTEDIHVALGYNFKNMKPPYESMLRSMGATYANGVWTYHNRALGKTFRVRFVENQEAFKQALRTEGAHIIYSGHSNYGLGAVFGTLTETASQTIENIRYIDDARILNT
ncbi:MAG: hypothetical protein AB1805_17065, partial [Nitrospirota bacterium]